MVQQHHTVRNVFLQPLSCQRALATLTRAARERTNAVRLTVVGVPAHYVASEESALVSYLNGGAARPTGRR